MNIQRICKGYSLDVERRSWPPAGQSARSNHAFPYWWLFWNRWSPTIPMKMSRFQKKPPMWIPYPATSDLSGGESSPRKVSYRESYRKSIRIPAAGGWYPALWEAGCTCDPGVEKKKGAQFAGDRKQNIILISFGDLRIHRSHQLWKSAIFI